MKNNVIASERLLIRPITKSDTDAIHEYAVSEWDKDNPNDREYVIVYEGNIIGT